MTQKQRRAKINNEHLTNKYRKTHQRSVSQKTVGAFSCFVASQWIQLPSGIRRKVCIIEAETALIGGLFRRRNFQSSL